jgi:hypothetical protein
MSKFILNIIVIFKMAEKEETKNETNSKEIYIEGEIEDKPELDEDSESVKAKEILDNAKNLEEKVVLRKGESLFLNILSIIAIVFGIIVFALLIYYVLTTIFNINFPKN